MNSIQTLNISLGSIHNALQDLISDSHIQKNIGRTPSVLIPRFQVTITKYGINGKGVKQAFVNDTNYKVQKM